MDYGYTILILLLPLFSFLVLGLCGMKMSHKAAGLIGTTSLGVVTVLSYLTAFQYFTAARTAEGVYATLEAFLSVHIAERIDMNHQADRRDDNQHHH